jgi:hypothetical protein
MNKLDDKAIVDRRLLETIRAILRNIDQCPTTLAMVNEALATDLTGWAAVVVEPTMEQAHAGRNARLSTYVHPMMDASVSDKISYAAMLKASPPLPGGGE